MAKEPENHAMHPLREMREEMRKRFDGVEKHLDALTERVAGLDMKSDGRWGQLSMIIGLLSGHQTRIETLEEAIKK